MLKNTRDGLPSGWKFPIKVKDQEILVMAYTYDDLMQRLREKTDFYGLPMPTDEEVQDYLTSINPENFSKGGGRKFHNTLVKMQGWVRAAYATHTKPDDEVLVPQEVAEQRAQICVSCGLNTNHFGCWSCVLADIGSGVLASGRKTKVDANLKACEVCGCPLEKSVHYKDEYLPNGDYPEWCWRKK